MYLESVWESNLEKEFAHVLKACMQLNFEMNYDSSNKLVTVLNAPAILTSLRELQARLSACEESDFASALGEAAPWLRDALARAVIFSAELVDQQTAYLRMRFLFSHVRTARQLHAFRNFYKAQDEQFKKLGTHLKVKPGAMAAVALAHMYIIHSCQ